MTHKLPRRYTELVHYPEDGKREPIVAGCFVAVSAPTSPSTLGLTDYRPQLRKVTDGPHYERNTKGEIVREMWTLNDGRKITRWDLTFVDFEAIVTETTAATLAVLAGEPLKHTTAIWTRAYHAAELAADAFSGATLEEFARVRDAEDGLHRARMALRQLLEQKIPTLARNLRMAGALTLAAMHGQPPKETA